MFRSYDDMKLDPDYMPLRYASGLDDEPSEEDDWAYDSWKENWAAW